MKSVIVLFIACAILLACNAPQDHKVKPVERKTDTSYGRSLKRIKDTFQLNVGAIPNRTSIDTALLNAGRTMLDSSRHSKFLQQIFFMTDENDASQVVFVRHGFRYTVFYEPNEQVMIIWFRKNTTWQKKDLYTISDENLDGVADFAVKGGDGSNQIFQLSTLSVYLKEKWERRYKRAKEDIVAFCRSID